MPSVLRMSSREDCSGLYLSKTQHLGPAQPLQQASQKSLKRVMYFVDKRPTARNHRSDPAGWQGPLRLSCIPVPDLVGVNSGEFKCASGVQDCYVVGRRHVVTD